MKILIILFFISFPILASAQLDCSLFKEGRFIYPETPGVMTVRKGLKQKSILRGKVMATWKVEWIDDCTFTLTCKKVKKSMPPIQKGDVLHCEMIHIQGTCFEVKVLLKRNGKIIVPATIGEMCLE